MKKPIVVLGIVVAIAFMAGVVDSQAVLPPGPTLSVSERTLHWTSTGSAKYRIHEVTSTGVKKDYFTTALTFTPTLTSGTATYKVKGRTPEATKWSNTVMVSFEGETQKEKEEREAKEKAEREQKEKEAKEQKEREERELKEKEQKEKEEKEKLGVGAGTVKQRLDAKSKMDSYPIEWFKKLSRLLAYPPAGDRYVKAGVQTLAYHDAWTTWGSSGATHKTEYDAWASRDKGVGYAGQFMDDINFQGGNIAGTRAQYRELIESVRATIGPTGVIEINAQYANIWPLIQKKDPDVLKSLEYVNVVTKEFNVDPTSGITTATGYKEFFEYTDFLAAKKVGITMTGDEHHNTSADKEYSLATYLLLNNGEDFIGFSEQGPGKEYAGLQLNIGNATSVRERASNGVWKRTFAGGSAYTVEPGAATQTITLPKAMKNLEGKTVTTVTISAAHGAVLQN